MPITPIVLYSLQGTDTAQGLWYTEETADMVQTILNAAYATLNTSGIPFFLSFFGPEEQVSMPDRQSPVLPRIRPKTISITFQEQHGAKYTLHKEDMLVWYTRGDGTTAYLALTKEHVSLCFTTTPPVSDRVPCLDVLRATIRESFPDYDVFSWMVSHGIDTYRFIDTLAPWYDRTTGIQHLYLDQEAHVNVSDLAILVALLPTHSTKYNKDLKYHIHFWRNKDSVCVVDKDFISTAYAQLDLLPAYRKDLVEGCTFVDEEETTEQELYQYACKRWVIFTAYRHKLP